MELENPSHVSALPLTEAMSNFLLYCYVEGENVGRAWLPCTPWGMQNPDSIDEEDRWRHYAPGKVVADGWRTHPQSAGGTPPQNDAAVLLYIQQNLDPEFTLKGGIPTPQIILGTRC